MFSPQDVVINEFFIENKGENAEFTAEEKMLIRENDVRRLKKMRYYCNTTDCLREYMLNYFGEYTNKTDCGNCCNCMAEFEEKEVTQTCMFIIEAIEKTGQRFGAGVIVSLLRGERKPKLAGYKLERYDVFGCCSQMTEAFLKAVIEQMLLKEYLTETNDMYKVLKLAEDSEKLINEEELFYMKWSERKAVAEKSRQRPGRNAGKNNIISLNAKGMALFERLKAVRFELARTEHVPPYIIFSDKTLVDMCVRLPFTREEMLAVNGVGENKYDRYGIRFMQEIIDYTDAVKENYRV